MKSLVGAGVGLLGGCVVSAGLWAYWTPRCNEACPPGVVVGMWMFIALVPLACGLGGYAWVMVPTPRRRWLIGMLSVGGVVAVALMAAALG